MKKNMMSLFGMCCVVALLSGVAYAQSADYRLVAEQSPNAFDASTSLKYSKSVNASSGGTVHNLTFRLTKLDFELSEGGRLVRERSERPITLRVQAGRVSPFLIRQLEACVEMFSSSDGYASTTEMTATFSGSQSRMSSAGLPIVIDSAEADITSLRCITKSNN